MCVGVVEEERALELNVVAATPLVGVVRTDGVHECDTALRAYHIGTYAAAHTTTATTLLCTTHAQNILEREVLLVYVVEQTNQRHSSIALEEVYISSHDPLVTLCDVVCVVFLPVRLVTHTCVHLTKLPLTHILLGDDVDGLETLTIVHTRELGIVAQLVEYLDTIYRLCRQRLDSGVYILTKELLAIYEDLLDGLTLRLDRSVGDGDTRHLLQETLHIGIVRHLECSCAVAKCVAILRCTHRLGGLDHLLDTLCSLLDVDLAERER